MRNATEIAADWNHSVADVEEVLAPLDLKALLEHVDEDEAEEVMDYMINTTGDFEVATMRFIHEADIDEIMRDELSGDTYVLGCFNADFMADILGCPAEVIEKVQEAEAFEALGTWMLEHIEEVQKSYAQADGYGHHFNHYNGEEYRVGKYYMFNT
jgi:hypothetical protein